MSKNIVVGLSGGVDSAIALILLKNQGWKPIGVSLKYAVWEDKSNAIKENICCNAESFSIAEKICKALDIPYHLVDVSDLFKKKVINYFTFELKNNNTPNPCVICNPELKFKVLLGLAKKYGISHVATGHYAQIKKDRRGKNFQLLMARDRQKDQTYSLCFLPYKWLKNILFPLGNYLKSEVYELAKDFGLEFYLKRKQSQDFCFVSKDSLKAFLGKTLGTNPGPIKEITGKIIGEHSGLHFYTIGQRKGINLPDGPYFVMKKSKKDNTLWVTRNEKDLLATKVTLYPYNFLASKPFKNEIKVSARLRYRQDLTEAKLSSHDGSIRLNFSKPKKNPTPGQFAVFYQNDVCLGGGRIKTTRIKK